MLVSLVLLTTGCVLSGNMVAAHMYMGWLSGAPSVEQIVADGTDTAKEELISRSS